MKGWWWVWGIVAVGAALRVMGMLDDFWLDEIWSWRIARGATSVVDVLSARVDNNHPLNTLILYWMGDVRWWPAYRVPAVVAGVGAVVLAVWRLGRVEGVCAAVLLGLSYPLVVYSSEARGYGLAVLFAVVGFRAMGEYLRRPTWGMSGAFGGAVVFGVLSHLTFLHFYLGAVVWSGVALRGRWWDWGRCHLGPMVFLVGWYFYFVRGMVVGGAQETGLRAAVGEALSVMGGGPAVVVGVVLVAGLAVIWVGRRERFWFYLTCVVVSPVVLVMASKGETLFPRYFLVAMVFGYLMVAEGMGVVWGRRWGRPIVIAVLGCFVLGSTYRTMEFLRGTRGHYAEAVAYMVEQSAGGVARVGSDNAFRGGTLVGFYSRYVGGRVEFVEGGEPEWFVVNATEAGVRPGEIRVGGEAYRFEREFTYRGLSGWSWYVFRRAVPGRG